MNLFSRNMLNYSPQLSYTYKNFTGKIGPIYGPSEITWWIPNLQREKKVNGGVFTLQVNPNKENKYFDLFFVYNFSALCYNTDSFPPSNYHFNFPKTLRVIDNTLGYGFNFKFLKNFYLTSSVAIGIAYEKTTYVDDGTYIYKGGMYNFTAGLGYNFKIKKGKTQNVDL